MYCLNLLGLALELAKKDPVYEDVATKFFEHFVYIGAAINRVGDSGLWNEEDGYYYDVLRLPDGRVFPIKAQTISGLIPIFAVRSRGSRGHRAASAISRSGCGGSPSTAPSSCAGLATSRAAACRTGYALAIVDTDKLARILMPVLDPEGMF